MKSISVKIVARLSTLPFEAWIGRRLLFHAIHAARSSGGTTEAHRALKILIFNGDVEETKQGKAVCVRLVRKGWKKESSPLICKGESKQDASGVRGARESSPEGGDKW